MLVVHLRQLRRVPQQLDRRLDQRLVRMQQTSQLFKLQSEDALV
jgi:hypothetical protein